MVSSGFLLLFSQGLVSGLLLLEEEEEEEEEETPFMMLETARVMTIAEAVKRGVAMVAGVGVFWGGFWWLVYGRWLVYGEEKGLWWEK